MTHLFGLYANVEIRYYIITPTVLIYIEQSLALLDEVNVCGCWDGCWEVRWMPPKTVNCSYQIASMQVRAVKLHDTNCYPAALESFCLVDLLHLRSI